MINQFDDPNDMATTDDVKLSQPKSLIDLEFATLDANVKPEEDKRDLVMSHKEARAGCPDDIAACGEEDTGSGLESLVTRGNETV